MHKLFFKIFYIMLIKEFLDDIHVNAVAYVQERLIVYGLLPAVYLHVFVYHIKSKVQMFSQ